MLRFVQFSRHDFAILGYLLSQFCAKVSKASRAACSSTAACCRCLPSAAVHGSLLYGLFLRGFDSFETYLFLHPDASILHLSGGLHNYWDVLQFRRQAGWENETLPWKCSRTPHFPARSLPPAPDRNGTHPVFAESLRRYAVVHGYSASHAEAAAGSLRLPVSAIPDTL